MIFWCDVLTPTKSADSSTPAESASVQAAEPHGGGAGRLNWLRAGVLGANDGIVSVAGIVVGVAGATSSRAPIFTAGIAGLAAGAVSMALGEYVSVSSQRDSEKALLSQETQELQETRTRSWPSSPRSTAPKACQGKPPAWSPANSRSTTRSVRI